MRRGGSRTPARFAWTLPALAALRGLLEIYDQCLSTFTERAMEEAFQRTKECIEQHLRNGAEAVTV